MVKAALFTGFSIVFSLLIACTATPTQESTGQFLDSAALTTKIKASLVDSLGAKGLAIQVKTWKEEVQLSGYVDNIHIKKRAAHIVSGVDGVKRVRNNIVVK